MDNSEKVYLKVLDARIDGLNKRINKVSQDINLRRVSLSNDEKKLIKLQNELKRIKKEKEEYIKTGKYIYNDSLTIDFLDSRYDHNKEKIEKVEKQIKGLKELKGKLYGNRAIERVERRIERKHHLIERLKKRECRISGVQRSVIVSKRVIANLRNTVRSNREASATYNSNRLHDTTMLKNNLDTGARGLTGVKNKVLSSIYELREKRLMKKQERHAKLLMKMQQSGGANLVGTRPLVVNDAATRQLRNTRDLVNQSIFSQLDIAPRKSSR